MRRSYTEEEKENMNKQLEAAGYPYPSIIFLAFKKGTRELHKKSKYNSFSLDRGHDNPIYLDPTAPLHELIEQTKLQLKEVFFEEILVLGHSTTLKQTITFEGVVNLLNSIFENHQSEHGIGKVRIQICGFGEEDRYIDSLNFGESITAPKNMSYLSVDGFFWDCDEKKNKPAKDSLNNIKKDRMDYTAKNPDFD